MPVQVDKRRFTTEEYYKMAEAGIFGEDDQVELLHGEIFEMSPVGNPHMACVKRLNVLLSPLNKEFVISIQDPISIDQFSEPEPDVAVLKYRQDFYQYQKPKPADVILLIEVADTSLEKDQKIKIPLYAYAGIPEVWLVDLQENKIIVYTEPVGAEYRQSRQYFPGEMVNSITLEKFQVAVSEVIWNG